MSSSKILGIVAGGGPLPARVAEAASRLGYHVFIVGLQGFAEPEVIQAWPHRLIRIGAAGEILSYLKENGCRELVLIGPIKRPSLRDLRPDTEGARVLTRLGRALFKGDDGLLATVVSLLAEEGFQVRGAHEFLCNAVGPEGVVGAVAPDDAAWADIAQGARVIDALGRLDIGQACVIQNGVVLAVEAMEGTDQMIIRAGECRQPGAGGVLVKLVKPGQERRADMPTIGLQTLEHAAQAGLRGVAFEAGGTLVMDFQACIREADQHGLFFVGVNPSKIIQ